MERRIYANGSIDLDGLIFSALRYGTVDGSWAVWAQIVRGSKRPWEGWVKPGWSQGDWMLDSIQRDKSGKYLVFCKKPA
jgi:hypothetical protein